MQGQKGAGNSFSETIDLNQGSVSSNNGPNQPTAWNSMLYPIDNPNGRTFGGWHAGESSSSASPNLQSHGLDANAGPSRIPYRDSLSRVSSGSTRLPLNINLNAEHMSSGSDGSPETFDTFPYNNVNNDGASSSSLGDWGSSFKRKALDGGSSNSLHQNEGFDTHDFHAFHSGSSRLNTPSPPLNPPSFSHSEELNLRIGIGRGIAHEVFPPLYVREIGESSSRNYGLRGNHDNDRFNNLPPARNTVRQSELFNRRQSSRPISPTATFEFRPSSSSAINQPQLMHTPEMPRNSPSFSFHRTANSARLTRNSRENSPYPNVSEMRNNANSSLENARNSSSHFSYPWGTPQQHGSLTNPQRSSQFSPWAPFPSVDSETGSSRRGHFPPLGSSQSALALLEETMMPSGANQGSHRHEPFPRPSMMTELQGDDVSGWHALAGIEGRHRLVSEIRHVLSVMRRGDSLRDEDYMIFDPFINGIAEFQDRHRDMRLDVDNMSYEELLALEERIGDVNTGLSEESILRSMKQRKHLCLFDQSSSNVEPCSICREDYFLGDDVGELDCGHDFHTDCIKQWLIQKNLCPICKMTALGT